MPPNTTAPRKKVICRGAWFEFGTDRTQHKTWQLEHHISESFAHFILITKWPDYIEIIACIDLKSQC